MSLHSSASTVFDAQDLGFRVILVEDACKGINPEKVEETILKIKENNGLVINSREVNRKPALFNCYDFVGYFYNFTLLLGKISGERK